MYGFNNDRSKAENVLDIGQENADLIGADLTNTLSTANTDFRGGTIKYDKIGDMVIVYVNGTTVADITGLTTISSRLPEEYRPQTSKLEKVRTLSTADLLIIHEGTVLLSPKSLTTIPSGTEIKGEIAYFV